MILIRKTYGDFFYISAMCRQILLLSLFWLITVTCVFSQWDTYQAIWEGKPGSVLVNMDWSRFAPAEDLTFLLVVETEVDSCNSNGFGSIQSSNQITKQNQSLDSLLSLYTYLESVGTFSHDCKIREYYYLRDTLGIAQRLRIHSFDRDYSYEVIEDKEWLGYLDFLYPDDFLIQTMINGRVIAQLVQQGDDVTKRRKVTHFAGFSSERNRKDFRSYIEGQGFFVSKEHYDTKEILPYYITFNRRDPLEISGISEITLHLALEAQEYYGSYDGWETEITD
ncbi:MAG: hypothetical protein ACI9FN_000232 [Saprospiraceae bacterium]|jgi:hypothetical protein